MNKPKNQFPLKIILSYLVIGAIAVVVSFLMYSEYKNYLASTEGSETEKVIETGTLINDVYETDSFSRIALLTRRQSDFDTYLQKSDSLYQKIEQLKALIPNPQQQIQLDSIRFLLGQKRTNIEELRNLKLRTARDSTLDNILNEFKKFNNTTGRYNLEDIIQYPDYLSRAERRAWSKWTEYFTENYAGMEKKNLTGFQVDSLLTIPRFIVLEAKKNRSKTQLALQEKENELLQNELDVSLKLRNIITDLDREIGSNQQMVAQQRDASEARTKYMLQLAGIVGALVMVLFSYIIVTDFFKAEKFKKGLEAEKLYSENLLKSREQLMATVSHDLKTPLNTIVGYAELFSHTDLTEKQQNYVQQMASSAYFISQMADDLLDFSKLEAGKLLIEKVPFSLENLLHQIAKASKDLYIQKPIELHLFIDDNLRGKFFESDPLRIQQIVNNLVSNAYKFTEKGRIQITANLLKRKKKDHLVELAVTDSGIGISKEKQGLIFKEFTQAEKDTFQKFGGSGLGLNISRKLAVLLGGSLEVESELGKGSTFFLTVPLQENTIQQPLESVPTPPPILKSSLNAVIFDDDPAMLALLKELFEHMNIKVRGFERFESFKKNGSMDFDFILTDIEMPQHNGFQILEALKKGEIAQFKDQPVIAMTGTQKFTRLEYIQMGFTDMLQKPFSKNQLIAALSPLFLNKIESSLPELEVFKNPSNELFDLSFMNSFLSSQESLNEVLAIFYQQSEEDLVRLDTAIQNFDCDSVENTAHRMLTMCRQLGAKRVNPILETMERCAMEKPTKEQMLALNSNLKVELSALLEALQNRNSVTT